MQVAISEKNHVPPTNTPPPPLPSLIMIFVSSGSVQNVVYEATELNWLQLDTESQIEDALYLSS